MGGDPQTPWGRGPSCGRPPTPARHPVCTPNLPLCAFGGRSPPPPWAYCTAGLVRWVEGRRPVGSRPPPSPPEDQRRDGVPGVGGQPGVRPLRGRRPPAPLRRASRAGSDIAYPTSSLSAVAGLPPLTPPLALILGGPSGGGCGRTPKSAASGHPCGAKPRGGGGAPPTVLILLRNQRSAPRPGRRSTRPASEARPRRSPEVARPTTVVPTTFARTIVAPLARLTTVAPERHARAPTSVRPTPNAHAERSGPSSSPTQRHERSVRSVSCGRLRERALVGKDPEKESWRTSSLRRWLRVALPSLLTAAPATARHQLRALAPPRSERAWLKSARSREPLSSAGVFAALRLASLRSRDLRSCEHSTLPVHPFADAQCYHPRSRIVR